MFNLLNAITPDSAAFWMVVVLGVLLLIELAVFAILFVRNRARQAEERRLLSITLDTEIVKREFQLGEQFDASGIIVTAHYNMEPNAERVTGFDVTPPDMTVAGKFLVTVSFAGMSAVYAISIVDPNAAPTPVVEKIVYVPAPVETVERKMIALKLNTDVARKTFKVGETFGTDDLVVVAHFNAEPFAERVSDFTVKAPDMSKVGKQFVTIGYQDFAVDYLVEIVEDKVEKDEPVVEEVVEEQPAVEEQPVVEEKPVVIPVEEESAEAGTLRYDKSFTARIIQSDDELKQWYTEIKNALLSYKKAKARMSWKRESFRLGREVLAKLGFRGKTLCIFLPLNADDFVDTKYKVENVADNAATVDTPCMLRIKNARRAKHAVELIQMAAEKYQAERIERESEDFYMPYEGVVELINKGLIKRNIVSKADEAFFQTTDKEVAVSTDSENK